MSTRIAALALAASLALGCAKPDPPKITPESAKVTGISLAGLDVEMTVSAENPNSMDLDAESMAAHVTLDQSVDLGTVTVPTSIHLPAKKSTRMTVPIHANWANLAAIVPLAQKNQNVPFLVEGTVKIGGALSVSMPFKVSGWVTRDQLLKIASGAVPKIPGLPF